MNTFTKRETSRVRKAISTPAGCPSTGRIYPSGINISPSEMGSDGQSGAAGLQFSESERFVEEAKFEPERPVELHDGRDLVNVENCPSELHCHIICRARRRSVEQSAQLPSGRQPFLLF
jgi:hypothetical protein